MGRRDRAGAHLRPDMESRQDVEEGQALHAPRMIEGETVADPCAAIVADHGEAHVAEFLHDGDHVLSHGPLE